VPSSFRIARNLLSRLEDERDGRIVLPEATVDIPVTRVEEAGHAAGVLGEAVYSKFPFIGSCKPAEASAAELILNRTWRASLEITGASGLPSAAEAGNVLRPATALRICLRLPPTADPEVVGSALTTLIEKDPPDGAEVEFVAEQLSAGWNAPPLDARLASSVDTASRQFFGRPAIQMGEGGTIPFMGLLGERFPEAQFVVTGVLGPHSNAHGPNEFLHLTAAKRMTCCIARVLHDMACV
jgi:acetylornithine deacetylase/succinyl-diaminopimelate desuccinylase-like protein